MLATVVQNIRNPYDHFFEYTIDNLMLLAPENSKGYYFWPDPLEQLEEMLNSIDCNYSTVFLFVSDNLNIGEYDPWSETRTWGVQIILNKINKHPNTNFILISDVINLESEVPPTPNLRIVNTEYLTTAWQGVNRGPGRTELLPVLDKNFDSTKTYISLNNRPASHRISSISYQLYNNLHLHGLITISPDINNFISTYNSYSDGVHWQFTSEQEISIKPMLEKGYSLISALATVDTDYKRAKLDQNRNFKHFLTPMYKNSFVEIVSETYYTESTFMCTEKILNCIYGCNIPIFLSSSGIVSHLRGLGFDLFDDVIDHSYDLIANPIDRLESAFSTNRRILVDSEYAKTQWLNCKDRIIENYNFAKNKMYDVIYERAKDQFINAVNTLT